MAAPLIINGVPVDPDDPCALYQALYAAKLKLLALEHVEEVEIQSPLTRRRLKLAPGNLAALNAELADLARACSARTDAPRARFAKQMRFSR